jgi:hypothetical protein
MGHRHPLSDLSPPMPSVANAVAAGSSAATGAAAMSYARGRS